MRTNQGEPRAIASKGSESSPATNSFRAIGIDAGAETLKFVEILRRAGRLEIARRELVEHGKQPGLRLLEALRRWGWPESQAAAVTGRFSPQINLPRIPIKQAQLRGYRFCFDNEPVTIVDIGSHGFSVLELRASGQTVFRENSRCSQGTGNFLRQLVERFSLTVEEASDLCADVAKPAPLSGRCPVILKTDMTHLANKGEDRARILAGLFDAVCENVFVLIKPGLSPSRVLLTGGVSRSPRVRRIFAESLARQGMHLMENTEEQALWLAAIGCALIAAEQELEQPSQPERASRSAACSPRVQDLSAHGPESRCPAALPSLDELLLPPRELKLEQLPSLASTLARVKRMPSQPWAPITDEPRTVTLGLDIGSTGSKALALDGATRETLWEAYRQTLGDPVGAAQHLLRSFTQSPAAKYPVAAFGVTGSGREVVSSLLSSCYGKEAVFVVNEIVAHATGALHYDTRVDTIFEIGGQDAKYIRLADGRIVDCAMNEACSAGTGSFIEEQGRKFAQVGDVRQLGQAAVAAPYGVSLGQHCSVFMAEVIDEAVGAGVEQSAIISGLYDSIIKNYLNRVKGNRSIGKIIFCQGMPFSADALAAAVARQTGSEVIVPPNPGTVGALGIALLATRELKAVSLRPLDLSRFLEARVEQKDTFVCRSNCGCGGAGNRCRIERLLTLVSNQRSAFTWGGGCSLHDKGTRKKKLPDLAPDPFREREDLLKELVAPFNVSRGKPRIALTSEFMLKGLFPFFTAFLYETGLDLEIVADAGASTLKRGIQSANVPFCAPMQLFHGLAEQLAETGATWLFVPRLRSLPRTDARGFSLVCPMVQASPDVIRWKFCGAHRADTAGVQQAPRLLSPLIDFDAGNFDSKLFQASCRRLAAELGLTGTEWREAFKAGAAVQRKFDEGCLQIGRRTLQFCQAQSVVPVVVLGRTYTVYNRVLNSNVPAILREQGAIGIPVDCYPVDSETPVFADMYWGYGQQILRTAHQVRRAPGVYSLYCSNYACGPDSFNLHFAAYIMQGKPFAVIETDGHSGDAGTKTRVEAFLHCVEEDKRAAASIPVATNFEDVQFSGFSLKNLRSRNGANERLLIPYVGPASEVGAAVLRGLGVDTESLPPPDADSLRLGRRYTSGKECLPMPLTLGSLLQRLERAKENERFIYLMTSTNGPCRFGVYNLLNNITLERLGWRDRVRIWSPKDTGYFDDFPAGTEMLILAGVVAGDALLQAQLDVRPVELQRGAAEAIYRRYLGELLARMESAARGDLSLAPALWQVASGRLFGVPQLLRRAGRDFAAMRGPGDLPLVELAGEMYVRSVEFSNDFIIDKLEERGMRVYLATKTEWINYCGHTRTREPGRNRFADRFSDLVRHRIEALAFAAISPSLGWPSLASAGELLQTAGPYIHNALEGEAVLTIGSPLYEWRRHYIDAVVNVGPLECMPTKIAETQFHHVSEQEGLLSLTLGLNGDPISTTALDNFAYEVRARFERRTGKV